MLISIVGSLWVWTPRHQTIVVSLLAEDEVDVESTVVLALNQMVSDIISDSITSSSVSSPHPVNTTISNRVIPLGMIVFRKAEFYAKKKGKLKRSG